jgi:hypothetical protein
LRKKTILNPNQAKINDHLEELCRNAGSRNIRPYMNYGPRAIALFPDVNEIKARGLYRGYVKKLIDQRLLIRVKRGIYFKTIESVEVKVRRTDISKKDRPMKKKSKEFNSKDLWSSLLGTNDPEEQAQTIVDYLDYLQKS